MTRGLRARPLREPEEDDTPPTVYADNGKSEVLSSDDVPLTDKPWLFKPGNRAAAREHRHNLDSVVRENLNPLQWFTEVASIAFKHGHREQLQALTLLADRGFGRPRQSVEVTTDEENPIVRELRRLADAYQQAEPGYTLIEAPTEPPSTDAP